MAISTVTLAAVGCIGRRTVGIHKFYLFALSFEVLSQHAAETTVDIAIKSSCRLGYNEVCKGFARSVLLHFFFKRGDCMNDV